MYLPHLSVLLLSDQSGTCLLYTSEEDDNSIECSSWSEVEQIVGEDLLEPTYLPDGYELKSLVIQSLDPIKVAVGRYEDTEGYYLRIEVDIYNESYTKDFLYYDETWTFLGEDIDGLRAQYYSKGEVVEAFVVYKKNMYYISGNVNLDVIEEIVDGIADK